jgi:hypothetical protein
MALGERGEAGWMGTQRLNLSLQPSYLTGRIIIMSDCDIDDFIRKLVTGECYIDPNAYINPHLNARHEELDAALANYGLLKAASVGLSKPISSHYESLSCSSSLPRLL